MTEFWVHTPKHYCTFCDIWIDDNKPSIMHHERGMRHQENVKKRMIDMKKKQTEADDTMKELERMHEVCFHVWHHRYCDPSVTRPLSQPWVARVKQPLKL